MTVLKYIPAESIEKDLQECSGMHSWRTRLNGENTSYAAGE